MGKDNTSTVKQKKNNKSVIKGPFVKGVSGNPNGRPKKGMTLTDAMRVYLDQKRDGATLTRKEEFVQRVAKLAYDGDVTAIKMIWNYIDGMPTQRQEITGADGNTLDIRIIEDEDLKNENE